MSKKIRIIPVCLLLFSFAAGNSYCLEQALAAAAQSPAKAAPLAKGSTMSAEDKLKAADENFTQKNYKKAKELYREVYFSAQKGPVAEKAFWGMSKSDYYLKNYYEARQNLKRFMSTFPQSHYLDEAGLLLGYVMLYSQQFKEAQTFFEQVRGAFKNEAAIGKAEVALKSGNIAKVDTLLEVLDRRTLDENPKALYLKAMVLSSKGKHIDAIDVINKIPEDALKDNEIRTDKALLLLNAGANIKDVVSICKAVLSKPSSSFESNSAKKILARIYESEGKTDDALKMNLEVVLFEPKDEVRLKIIALYEKKGDTENILKYTSYLRDKKLRDSEIEKRLKSIISSNNPKALDYMLRFSGYLEPENQFLTEAARYLISHGKKYEGVTLLKKAVRSTEGGKAGLEMAGILTDEGKYAEAKKILLPLVADKSYSSRATYMIADIMEREGNFKGALDYLERIMKATKDFRLAARMGDLYYKTGDRANALKYYVMTADKGDPGYSVKAADCFYLSGNHTKAKAYYKKALDYGIKAPDTLQWTHYQYGKLSNDKDHLRKAKDGGGNIAAAAAILLKEE